ncbi:MAG TPA: hypothetical protein VN703_07485 [Candidatus Sulfopaludibacter sp.]|nr:hypothetical protein [Candidatus Sulfopaludibacter sp.]
MNIIQEIKDNLPADIIKYILYDYAMPNDNVLTYIYCYYCGERKYKDFSVAYYANSYPWSRNEITGEKYQNDLKCHDCMHTLEEDVKVVKKRKKYEKNL